MEYKSHFNAENFYDRTRFYPRVIQSAELNEIEERNQWARASLHGSLVKDGSLISHKFYVTDNVLYVNVSFYYQGFIRKFIGERDLKAVILPLDVYLRPKEILVDNEKAGLGDPDSRSPNQDELGADRIQIDFEISFKEGIFLFRITEDGAFLTPSTVKDLSNHFILNKNEFTVGEFADYPDLHTALEQAKPGDVLHVVSNQYTTKPFEIKSNFLNIRFKEYVKIEGDPDLWGMLKPGCLFHVKAKGVRFNGGLIGARVDETTGKTQNLFKVEKNCSVLGTEIFIFGFSDLKKSGDGVLIAKTFVRIDV